MTRRSFLLAPTVVYTLLSAIPLQAALPLTEVLARMDQRQETLEDVTFQFVERVQRGDLPEEQIAGKVQVKKPHALRMDQTAPQKQVLISDGVTFWLYTPAQKQQLKGDWKAWVKQAHFPLPLIDFIGTLSPEHWRDQYKVYFGGLENHHYALRFKPLRDDVPLTLWVSEETFLPVRGEMQENGLKVQVVLTEMQTNTGLKSKLFNPRVPAGTQEIPVSF